MRTRALTSILLASSALATAMATPAFAQSGDDDAVDEIVVAATVDSD